MKIGLKKNVLISTPNDSLNSVIKRMGRVSDKIIEINLVVDKKMKLKGILNSADIIRLLANKTSMHKKVKDVMIQNPITASIFSSDDEILKIVRSKVSKRTEGKKDLTRFIPLLDKNGIVHDVMDIFSLLNRFPRKGDNVEVYGLGFVGLTLAVSLTGRGHIVRGIDISSELIRNLNKGRPNIFEPLLPDMMRKAIENKQLSFRTSPDKEHSRVVIISVGTPIKKNGFPFLKSLTDVCNLVGSRLLRGDLVMLRSTVPVGTTRNIVANLLKKKSGLVPGEDFNLAFAPERTVEGQALKELTSLPQIIGGFSKNCTERATAFWQSLTPSVVHVNSLEEAEFVKLINNSYRDLSFAFANGLALMSDKINLNAYNIIAAANEGYPRNLIPRPSPGVGGYCLTKDPFIYSHFDPKSFSSQLSIIGRKVNLEAGKYPIKTVEKFIKFLKKPFSKITIMIAGLAFKGLPETNDLRGSIGIEIAREFLKKKCKVFGYDSVVDNKTMESYGIHSVDLIEGIKKCDIFLILNNHPNNISNGLLKAAEGKKRLIFDGWSLLDSNDVEQRKNLYYATMGYMSTLIK